MSDFLSEFVAADAPVAREVSFAGKTGTVYFRRVSSDQRQALLNGQRVHGRVGEKAEFELDLGADHKSKQLLVQFSVCKEDGKPFFKDLAAVKAVQADRVEALYEHARVVNESVLEVDQKKG